MKRFASLFGIMFVYTIYIVTVCFLTTPKEDVMKHLYSIARNSYYIGCMDDANSMYINDLCIQKAKQYETYLKEKLGN